MNLFRTTRRCFCAFCRSPRFVYIKKHVSVLDVVLAAASSLLVSFIVFQDLDPRAVVFFAVALAVTEMFIIFRWRLSIACPHCGFDPVTYKKTPDKAVQRVRSHMKERREDPASAFATPLRIAKLRRTASAPLAPGGAKPTSAAAKLSAATGSMPTSSTPLPAPAKTPPKMSGRPAPPGGR